MTDDSLSNHAVERMNLRSIYKSNILAAIKSGDVYVDHGRGTCKFKLEDLVVIVGLKTKKIVTAYYDTPSQFKDEIDTDSTYYETGWNEDKPKRCGRKTRLKRLILKSRKNKCDKVNPHILMRCPERYDEVI